MDPLSARRAAQKLPPAVAYAGYRVFMAAHVPLGAEERGPGIRHVDHDVGVGVSAPVVAEFDYPPPDQDIRNLHG